MFSILKIETHNFYGSTHTKLNTLYLIGNYYLINEEYTMLNPERVIFEKHALDYPMGKSLEEYFLQKTNVEKYYVASNRIKSTIPGDDLPNFYENGKRTLVVGLKKGSTFQACRPSAHYQLPLVSGCMGKCQYCYLNTRLGDKPYIKVNVNIDDILGQAEKYMQERLPSITLFEGSATSDPVPIEPYTHSLAQAIKFFADSEHGRFRFVTKFTDIDSLTNIQHNGHTEVRFSINTDTVISQYELSTASRDNRISASCKMMKAGYRVGFLIAPVFLYPNWEEDYTNLLIRLKEQLPEKINYPLTFEIITHRYTTTAKNKILEIFPGTTLPMNDEERQYKHGQFGYGKWIYPKDAMAQVKAFFTEMIPKYFANGEIKYIV